MTRMTIGRAVTTLAERDPERVSVRDAQSAISRRELDRRATSLAHLLIDNGVRVDDLVTVRGGNTIAFVVACVAVWKAGATPQPLAIGLPVRERDAVLDVARPSIVLGGERLADRPWLPLDPSLAGASDDELPDLAAASWKAPTTSGSTGRRKIVLAAGSAHVDPDAPVAAFIPRKARQLVAGPLVHAAPFVYAFRGLMTGHELTLLPRFDAAEWVDRVEREAITWGMVVPTMMSRIATLDPITRDRERVASLDSVLHLGAVCPPHVKRTWIDWLGPTRVVEVYSGTESPGLTVIRGDEWLAHPGSVGRAAAGSRVRIVDGDGTELPHGETGLVELTREGGPAYRYLGAPARDRDGWDTLGDVGRLDDDGYLYLVDRADDLIVSGGVNVWPAAVESALERHPAIRSCAVVGVPDDDLGRAALAVVDLAGAHLGEGELAAWAARELEPELRPRHWRLVTEPVRDDTGKVRRSTLVAPGHSDV